MADEQKKVTKKKVAKKASSKKTASKKTASKKTASKKTASKKVATKASETAPAAGSKPAAPKPSSGRMRVTLVKSLIGTIGRHRETVRGMGLRRLNHTVELEDTPATRGMVKKVQYLVRVEKD